MLAVRMLPLSLLCLSNFFNSVNWKHSLCPQNLLRIGAQSVTYLSMRTWVWIPGTPLKSPTYNPSTREKEGGSLGHAGSQSCQISELQLRWKILSWKNEVRCNTGRHLTSKMRREGTQNNAWHLLWQSHAHTHMHAFTNTHAQTCTHINNTITSEEKYCSLDQWGHA